MSAQSGSKPVKKRAGRKRQPPLAPGPALQFVVASHPSQFKNENTMRHVRSHVMYKHRGEQRGGSPTEGSRSRQSSAALTRTPSPMTTSSDGALEDTFNLPPAARLRSTVWDDAWYQYMSQSPSIDPLRNLAARIIAATTAEPARSAPPTFEHESEYPFPSAATFSGSENLDELREIFLKTSNLIDGDDLSACRWMRMMCSNRMSFLSQISVVCVYQDVAEGFLDDTALTIYAKTKLMKTINDNLNTHTDDFTILSIVNLLVSEIGGQNEDVFDVHQEGLVRIVQQRGGIANLGVDYYIATFLIVVLLSFTVLRGRPEPAMLQGFTPEPLSRSIGSHRPISPLYAPEGNISGIYGRCSVDTFEILQDMHELTRTFLSRWSYPESEDAVADSRLEQIYTRLLYRPSTEDNVLRDWIYESCRIAALIYCRSIVQGMPLSQSANVMHARSSGSGTATSLITALHRAVEQTDRAGHWGDMSGALLWVYLVGGAASWPSFQPLYVELPEPQSSTAWTRKWFALHAVRTSLSINFDHADAIVESQRTMLQVQHMISLRRGGPR
ncbi:hypothetical protein DPSP01_007445 [Paraphaeosphaeria sporulosa]|uniref:Tachykinin family protein n=1 Tax=Paraphaeosphaeria sporulosa TaxID=1460663 RepID=A0A177CVY1_9PLEO|nr:uncharacterized protein CC84DRAFT_42290 [Paraphaeosphaeria sporulosa]OAG11683.1 hypothetical protein CC84DRAFT_42290 [Paraphaeosphaeria sporulosa]